MLFIVLIIINFLFIVLNRKNKKLMICFTVHVIFYIMMSITVCNNDGFNALVVKDYWTRLWDIIPAMIFFAILIFEVCHKKYIKKIIFCILGIIMCIIMFIVNEHNMALTYGFAFNSYIWCLITTIMQFIYNKESNEGRKINKIINIILLIIFLIFLIFTIVKYSVMLNQLYKTDNQSVKFLNQLKTGLSNSNTNATVIRVKKNNKFGCIDQTGKEIVPCEYDELFLSGYSKGNFIFRPRYMIAIKGNVYYYLSNNGDVIVSNSEYPTPFLKGNVLERANQSNMALSMVQTILSQYLEEYTDKYQDNDGNILLPYEHTFNEEDYSEATYSVHVYNLKNDCKLEVEDTETDKSYNIRIKKDGKIIYKCEDVSLSILEYWCYDGGIITYTDGSIPFYNLNKKIQGYYNDSSLEWEILHGSYEILDILDGNILIRDYTDINNVREIIVDKSTKQTLLSAKEIRTIENGYIVKKENNKMVFVDKNLHEVTGEYDFIDSENKAYYYEGYYYCLDEIYYEYYKVN